MNFRQNDVFFVANQYRVNLFSTSGPFISLLSGILHQMM